MSLRRILTVAGVSLGTLQAQAHVRQRIYVSGQESIVAWPEGTAIKVDMHQFSGNVGSGSTATSIDFSSAQSVAGASIAQWTGSGVTLFGGLLPKLTMDLTGGLPNPISSNCETTSDGSVDGINNLVFTRKIDESCAVSLVPSSGVIGLTKVAFRQSNGEIVEADIQFDDSEFLFKTSGSNNLSPSGGAPKEILLKDVMVHEFGHFFGLDHSPIRESTMLFAIADNLQTTKTDDQMGIFSVYPPTNLAAATGTAKGSLMKADGSAVFGAVVFALNARTLKPNASEMTDLNGAFEFCALPPGPQLMYASSYRPYGVNIHDYYSTDGAGGTETDGECYNPGCTVMTLDTEKSFFTKTASAGADGGLAFRIVNVPTGGTASYINITANEAEPTVNEIGASNTLALDEPRVARLSQSDIPLSGQATNIGTHLYRFVAPSSGNVQIRTAALGIYSRVKLKVELLDSAATVDEGVTKCPVSAGSGEAFDEPSTVNPSTDISLARDPWLNCTGLSSGTTYTVRITGTGLSCRDVPGNKQSCESSGESSSTAVPYYILTVFETSKLTDTTLADSLAASSAAASSYSNLPTCGERSLTVGGAKDSSPQTETKKKGACCGILSHQVPGGPSGPASLLLSLALSPVTWFALAWLSRRGRARIIKAIQ